MFMSAEEHLAKLGITVQQAKDFINSNLNQPQEIFDKADFYAVTTDMLSEITNYSSDIVREYFASYGLDSNSLDDIGILINSDLDSLKHLVTTNERTGILSNASLSETVRPLLKLQVFYDSTFTEIYPFQSDDGFYDEEELGVENLSIPATDKNIESLFYGTLLNIFSALDREELNKIDTFPSDGNPEELQALLINALNESSSPIIRSDEELVGLVTSEAVKIIDKYWDSDDEIELNGILDYSILNLAAS